MTTLTLSMEEETKQEFKSLAWVNWSEIAREEVIQKLILEHYLKTGTLTDEEWQWCTQVDWHPVDEFPYKKEFVQKIQARRKGPFKRYNSVEELFSKR